MAKDLLSALHHAGNTLTGVRFKRTRGEWSLLAAETLRLPPPAAAAGADGETHGAPGGSKAPASDAVQTDAPVEARRFAASLPDPVTFCIESRLAQFQYLEVPVGDADEVAEMAALQAESRKLLPLPAEEMTIALEVLERGAETLRLLLCAVPTAALDAIPIHTGLAPERIRRIDVAALAALRAAPPPAGDGARRLRLMEESGELTAIVLDDGKPVLVRALGPVAAPPALAMRLLRLSLLQTEAEQGTSLPLAGIEIDAGSPLPEEWLAALGALAPVSPAPSGSSGTAQPASQPLQGAARSCAALGAALRSAERVAFDLVPAAWREAQAARSHRRGMLRVLGAAAVLWIVSALALFLGPKTIDRLCVSEQAAVDALEPAVRSVSDVRHRVRLIRSYSDRTYSPLEVLREISILLPDGITLVDMRYKREEARVVTRATATTTELAYAFKQSVDDSALFSESKFSSGPTTNARTGGADFELTILLSAPQPEEGGTQ